MIKLLNCRIDETQEKFGEKKIVFFGQGTWLKSVEFTPLMKLQSNFAYVIDNNPQERVTVGNRTLDVYYPDRVKNENDLVIILTSPIYMYEMYMQLVNMELNGDIDCYAFPFMQKVTCNKSDFSIKHSDFDDNKIPKIIHSFWFSGDPKPELYQKCRDSWGRVLSDYKIIEWNKDNYDWHKNEFVEKAIECQAWAFASDYARLDVLKQYGGIYLDMDVEVFKPFNDLLGNDAILSFSNNTMIDLAVIGARAENPLICKMLDLYENVAHPNEKKDFSSFFQPSFVRKTLAKAGISMDGTLQRTSDATVFPQEFFMPLDVVLFEEEKKTERTYCIHYDNFGWSINSENKRQKKICDNRKLWELLS